MDYLEFIARVKSYIPGKGQVREAADGCSAPIRVPDVVFCKRRGNGHAQRTSGIFPAWSSGMSQDLGLAGNQ